MICIHLGHIILYFLCPSDKYYYRGDLLSLIVATPQTVGRLEHDKKNILTMLIKGYYELVPQNKF